jgi:hypothetical protein
VFAVSTVFAFSIASVCNIAVSQFINLKPNTCRSYVWICILNLRNSFLNIKNNIIYSMRTRYLEFWNYKLEYLQFSVSHTSMLTMFFFFFRIGVEIWVLHTQVKIKNWHDEWLYIVLRIDQVQLNFQTELI